MDKTLLLAATHNSFTVSWKKPPFTDPETYIVHFRMTHAPERWMSLRTLDKSHKFTMHDLPSNTKYEVKVSAFSGTEVGPQWEESDEISTKSVVFKSKLETTLDNGSIAGSFSKYAVPGKLERDIKMKIQTEIGRWLTSQSVKRRAYLNINRQHPYGKKESIAPSWPLQPENLCKYYTLTCKYPKCSFSCSGGNLNMFEKHLRQCIYIKIKCPNKQCLFTCSQHAMKEHMEKCEFSLTKCPEENCDFKTERKNLASHTIDCSHRMISCENKLHGCAAIVPFIDLLEHLETCAWVTESCDRCKETFLRKDKPGHDCPKAIVECQHCSAKIEKSECVKHFLISCNANEDKVKCSVCVRYIKQNLITNMNEYKQEHELHSYPKTTNKTSYDDVVEECFLQSKTH